MKGKWVGKYWYSKDAPGELATRLTSFELIIDNCDDSKITGQISDDLESGGTKGIGTIKGKVKKNKIKFVKRMPIKTLVFPDGTKFESDNPHRPIYYRGTINSNDQTVKGDWKFKKGIGFINGRLVFYQGIRGHWEMKKVNP